MKIYPKMKKILLNVLLKMLIYINLYLVINHQNQKKNMNDISTFQK